MEEGTFRAGGYRPLAHQEQEACDRDEAGQKRPEKNFAIGMTASFEEPERAERADDGTEGVHQALKAERAAVRVRRNVRGQQSSLRTRSNTSAELGCATS